MRANLVLFYEEKNYLEVAKTAPEIMNKFNLALCQIKSITLLSSCCTTQDIINNLTSNTIIGVGECKKECLVNIYTALKNFYQTEPVKTSYGFICSANNRFCSVVDLVAGINHLDRDNLLQLYNLKNVFYFGLYGLNQTELCAKLKNVENLHYFDFAYFFDCDICFVSFAPKENATIKEIDELKRNFTIEFNKYIYCDEPLSLEECVEDLFNIRRIKLAFVDTTELNILDQFQDMPNFKKYVQLLPNDILCNLYNLSQIKDLLSIYDLSFLLLITQERDKIKLEIFDEFDRHNFEFLISNNREFDLKFLKNLILHKIFIKLHKNALFFP